MNRKILLIGLILAAFFSFAQEQQPQQASSLQALSLEQAVAYAFSNNVNVLNAQLDQIAAVNRKREIIGIGLPQITGSFDVKDFAQLPTNFIPGEFFGASPGTFIPVKFGTKYNSTVGGQLSQLVFSGDYLVALTSTSVLQELAQKSADRAKVETRVAVSKAYYNALITKERLKLLDANIIRLKKLLDDTKALNENGFVEKIDADRVQVAYNNLLVEKDKVDRLAGLTETLLKFQMGMDLKTPIVLTDSLVINANELSDPAFTDKITYSSRPEYGLLELQKKLHEKDVMKNRYSYLPSIVFYTNVSAQQQSNEFEAFEVGKKWYPIVVLGGTLNLPIFTGFQRYHKLQGAKLNLLKTTNSLKALESGIQLEAQSSYSTLKNSFLSLSMMQANMKLAENVYDVAKIKYDEGVGSNIEIINAETSLKESQTNYYNALTDYHLAKIDYLKATGQLK